MPCADRTIARASSARPSHTPTQQSSHAHAHARSRDHLGIGHLAHRRTRLAGNSGSIGGIVRRQSQHGVHIAAFFLRGCALEGLRSTERNPVDFFSEEINAFSVLKNLENGFFVKVALYLRTGFR